MIQKAGLGIAVANARDEVKAAANYVTSKDNDNDALSEVVDLIL
jgi:hydroxymethylpyrimidine pyrophosphatase-like HAD family hydrolase